MLYLGALGDRYGRKLMLILGVALSIPACLLAAFAPSDTVLFVARLFGGVAAGMAYPTTLALITALWSGPARTKSIALWSALGGAISSLGPLVAGALLEHFWWGSVFLVTLPLAVVALVLAWRFVPAHVNETTDPVDNLGGVLSALLVGALILAINFAPVPDKGTLVLGLAIIALAALIAFVIRQTAGQGPAVRPARRGPARVLGRGGGRHHRVRLADGRDVHRAAVPAERARLLDDRGRRRDPPGGGHDGAHRARARPSSSSRTARASRSSSATSSVSSVSSRCCVLWDDGAAYWQVALGYAFVGVGVGFAGTPASHSLTGSVPVTRAGMASGTADLQRDLGGAIMQSILGALLTAGYASGGHEADRGRAEQRPGHRQRAERADEVVLQRREDARSSTRSTRARSSPARSSRSSTGRTGRTRPGIVAILLGAALVFFLFPKRESERHCSRDIKPRTRWRRDQPTDRP